MDSITRQTLSVAEAEVFRADRLKQLVSKR